MQIKDIITSALAHNARERPSIEQLVLLLKGVEVRALPGLGWAWQKVQGSVERGNTIWALLDNPHPPRPSHRVLHASARSNPSTWKRWTGR